jgi:hypothetical protein
MLADVQRMLAGACSLVALLLVLFPWAMKIYETSWLFREKTDPSDYDGAKDYFEGTEIPFQPMIDNPKTMMRVYFFVIPYIIATFLIGITFLLQRGASKPEARSPSAQKFAINARKVLRYPFHLPKVLVNMGFPSCLVVGEMLGIFVFLAFNWGTLHSRLYRSLGRGSKKLVYLKDTDKDMQKMPIDPYSWQAAEIWGLTMGILCILNLGWWILMPIGRRSTFLEIVGLPWDRAIKYHRWVGYYTVALSFAHGLSYVALIDHGNGNPRYDPDGVLYAQNLHASGCDEEGACDEDQKHLLRRNMYGIAAFVLCCVMTIFSVDFIRRKHFELFYYTHHLFILVIVFLCLHYKDTILYILPGLAMYMVDKMFGLLAQIDSGEVSIKQVSEDVAEVSVRINSTLSPYKSGQYVFVNFPEISKLQWHPCEWALSVASV